MSEQLAERQPWDRMEDESEAAYSRFTIYRSLGPGRSLDSAYRLTLENHVSEGIEKYRAPGNWREECVTFGWVQRAVAWDVFNFRTIGTQFVVRYIEVLNKLSERLLNELATADIGSAAWDRILDSISLLTGVCPPEAIQAVSRRSGSSGTGSGAGRLGS